jgi:hypothetical protein
MVSALRHTTLLGLRLVELLHWCRCRGSSSGLEFFFLDTLGWASGASIKHVFRTPVLCWVVRKPEGPSDSCEQCIKVIEHHILYFQVRFFS